MIMNIMGGMMRRSVRAYQEAASHEVACDFSSCGG